MCYKFAETSQILNCARINFAKISTSRPVFLCLFSENFESGFSFNKALVENWCITFKKEPLCKGCKNQLYANYHLNFYILGTKLLFKSAEKCYNKVGQL